MPRWFLYLNGVALLVMGGTMLTLRLREGKPLQHLFGYLWALLCLTAGAVLILMGHGHLPQPGVRSAPPRASHNIEFPSGR